MSSYSSRRRAPASSHMEESVLDRINREVFLTFIFLSNFEKWGLN